MDDPTAPNFESAALVTIDVQCDTLDGQPLEVPGTTDAVPQIAALCDTFRRANLPVVHMIRLYRADGSNAERSRVRLVRGDVPVFRPGTRGRHLADGILATSAPAIDDELLLAGGIQTVGPNEVVMYKPRWGAFYATPLEQYLHEASIDTVVFAGCNYPNCPRTSMYEASERDYRIVLASDAMSGLYDRGLEELRNIGVHSLASGDITTAISRLQR
jgi:nicotinamidase-related amidase